MTVPPDPSDNPASDDDDPRDDDLSSLEETLNNDDMSSSMESTVDSIEEVFEERPTISAGHSHQDEEPGTNQDDDPKVGEVTMPFGIDLTQIVDPAQLESTHGIEAADSTPNDGTFGSGESEDTIQVETPVDPSDNDSPATISTTRVSSGSADKQSLESFDQTVRLEDTADQNLIDATVQIGGSTRETGLASKTGIGSDTPSHSTGAIDQNDIGQTVNPRELSGTDAAFWGSLLQNGTGKTSSRGEITKVTPAIERTISETNLQIRVRDLATPKQPADTESDYRLMKLLGKGGMGNVFVAKQSSLDRLIAVKVIKPLEKAKRNKLKKQGRLEEVEEDRRQQFLSEAVVTGDLDHPNIVPIHDIAVTGDNTLFYAMKRVVGTPWSKVLKEKSRDENLDILLKTADAIGFAHTRGVVHRDIKPENIMLGDFGVVLVMDWGLALAKPEFEKIDSISHTAGLGGTPAFMAPEMATGPMEKIGPASDIYLLGATLFLIVTGRPPHQAPNITQCIKAVARNEITGDIESFRGELMNIALRAMAKEPANRYADVKQFQEAIRQYRSHAESIALAVRADSDAKQGNRENDYTLFSRATYGYEQAIALWQENDLARDGLQKTKLAHANAALKNEDFDLGLSLLDTNDSTHQDLIDALREGQRERELRQSRLSLFKRIAVAMLAFILVGGAIAFYFINDQRNKAIAAGDMAEEHAKLAQAATREVEDEKENVLRQKAIAEAKTKEAEENFRIAEQKTIEARNQRMIAEKHREDAERNETIAEANAIEARENALRASENEAEAKKQRGIALQKADEALRQTAKAQYEVYLSQIGLAKARIERNEFDDARQKLKDARVSRGVSHLGWEWRWLWRQANQSTFANRADAALLDLSLSDDGRRGVAVLDDGAVQLVFVGGNGSLDSKRVALSAQVRITAAAISGDGTRIALGLNSGDVELWNAGLTKRQSRWNEHEQAVTSLLFADEDRIVSASLDRTVKFWKTGGTKSVSTLWHIAPVRKLAIATATDRSLVVAAAVADRTTGRVVLWQSDSADEARSPRRLGEFLQHDEPVASIALSPDGSLAASGDIAGNVLLWRTASVRRTDYKSAVNDAIQSVSGNSAVSQSKSNRSIKVARLIDPSLQNPDDAASDQQLVSTPTETRVRSKAHSDLVESIHFSRDGKRLLSTSHDYTTKVWEVDSRRLEKTLRGHGGWVTAATFIGNDHEKVLSVSKDASIRSWDIKQTNGESTLIRQKSELENELSVVSSAQPHADEIWSARFDPAGQRIVSASRDHTARVLQIDRDTMQFREVARLELKDRDDDSVKDRLAEGTAFRAMSVAVDRANGHLFVGSADATVRIWDLVRGTQLGKLSGTGLNRILALSDNGRLALTGSSSPKAKAILWGIDPSGLKPPRTLYRLKGHQEAVTAFAISGDGKTLFTGDRIGIGYFWDTKTGQRKPQRIEATRGFRINDAQFSPDGNELLMVSDDQNLTRIDVVTGKRLTRLNHDGFVTQLSISSDGNHALTISESSTKRSFQSHVTLWNLNRGSKKVIDRIVAGQTQETTDAEERSRRESNIDRFLSARFGTENDRAIISRGSGRDQSGQLTLVKIGKDGTSESQTLQLPRRLGPAEVALPLPGAYLVTLNGDAAFLWDLETMTHRTSYRAHAAVTQSSFSFDGRFIATGSRSLKIWDAASGSAVGKLESPHRGAVLSVQFSTRGPEYLIATAGEDGLACVWNWQPKTRTFTKQREFQLSDDSSVVARTVCFSGDGTQLLVAGDSGHARLFSTTAKTLMLNLDQESGISFTCSDFSNDGKWIVLGSDDKKARLFSIGELSDEVAAPIVFEGHADRIEDVAIIQDASKELRVLTASLDKSARLWDPQIDSPSRRARELLTLRRHSLGVTAVDVTRDGNLVMTAGRDGMVVLWPAAPSDAIIDDDVPANLFDDLSLEE